MKTPLAASLSAALLLAGAHARAQVVVDSAVRVEVWVTGLDSPTTMAFIGNDDLLVLQKNDGRVRRIVGGILQPGEVLDLPVDSSFDKGLLGITLDPDFVNDRWVFLDFSEALVDGDVAFANRVYRYTWDGSRLVDPRLVLDLPNTVKLRIGGIVAFGRDDMLYTMMGDLQRAGKLQNKATGPDPDDTSVILRTYSDGSAPPDNPFAGASGTLAPMRRYFAYGIRNSFGMTVDPVTGALWDTENGQSAYDEVNRIEPGMNSGWQKIQGPDARSPVHQDQLWVAPGSHYVEPKFSWFIPVAPSAITFLVNPKLGCGRVHDVLIGDTNCGNIHHLVPNAARDGFVFASADLQDLVADNPTDLCTQEQDEIRFGSGFGVVTDIKTGPDGLVYVAELLTGTIYRLVPNLSAEADADADGVDDACDCGASDPGAWSATVEVPRLRLSRGAGTTLGWDSQRASSGPGTTYDVVSGSLAALRGGGGSIACSLGAGISETRIVDSLPPPPPGGALFYLVRAGNSCGAGTYGDSNTTPDPRDLLDAALPSPCGGGSR